MDKLEELQHRYFRGYGYSENGAQPRFFGARWLV